MNPVDLWAAAGRGDDLSGSNLPCCDDGSAPALDVSALPSTVADALVGALQDLQDAEAQLMEMFGEITAGLQTEIETHTSLLNSMFDEITGAIDVLLSEHEANTMRMFNKLVSDVDKVLNQSCDWCGQVGMTMPWHPSQQVAEGNLPPVQMMSNAIPNVAALFGSQGVTEPQTTDTSAQEQPQYDSTGDLFIAYIPTGRRNGDSGQPDSSGGGLNLPSVPPVGQTPLPSPLASGGPIPIVNVTVNVPPITVPPTVPCPPPVMPGEEEEEPTSPPPPAPPGEERGSMTGRQKGTPPPVPEFRSGIAQGFGQPLPPVSPSTPTPLPQPPPTAPSAAPTPATVPSAFSFSPSGPTPGSTSILFPIVTGLVKVAGPDGVNWNEVSACPKLPSLMQRPFGDQSGKPPPLTTDSLDAWWQNRTPGNVDPQQLRDAANKRLGKDGRTWLGAAFSGIKNTAVDIANVVGEQAAAELASTALSPTSTANPAATLYYAARIGLANWSEQKTGLPLNYLYQSDTYLMQYANPQLLPNQIRIDDALLNATIDEDTWLCWTRANGNLPEPARRILLANQDRPSTNELIQLWRRGFLRDEDLFKRVRERGVLDPSYTKEWIEISKALPTQSDLIRFMVRDAADEDVAKKYQYDKDFTDKYTAQLKVWAKALGLDDKYFQMMWRAHWEIPSYTQLREMFHRLRPDRPEVTKWDALASVVGAAAATVQQGPRPPVVTLPDIQEALEVNDLAPRWVDPQIAVSYLPINRTDSVRAYMIGAFDDDRLVNAFRDVGYSPADSQTLLNFYRQDKARRRANVTGGWSARKVLRYYKTGAINRKQATELLQPITANSAEIESTLNAADTEQAADTRARALKGIRAQFLRGEISGTEAGDMMAKLGVDLKVVDRLLPLWAIDRDSKYKTLSSAQAADMLKKGLIGVDEAKRRLRNLGYPIRDAELIIARALKVEGDTEGLTTDELDSAIGTAIKNKKQAKETSDKGLSRRIGHITTELLRLIHEYNRRNAGPDVAPLKPGDMP